MRTMQKGGKRRYYTRYLTHYTKKNYALLGLGLLFLTGILAGTLLYGFAEGETLTLLGELVTGFVEKRRTQGVAANFTASLSSSLVFVAVLFCGGFCALAHPVVIVAPLFRGLGFGFSVASLYAAYGASAAGFVGLYVMPNMLLTTVAILFCCREALRLSSSLWKLLRHKNGEEGSYSLRLYVARFLVAALVCGGSALLESFTYYLFAKYIVLG